MLDKGLLNNLHGMMVARDFWGSQGDRGDQGDDGGSKNLDSFPIWCGD